MGLVSFWLDSEYTYGSVESYDYSNERASFKNKADLQTHFAMLSREQVLAHEKYSIFAQYASAIGIDKQQEIPRWIEIASMKEKMEEEKKVKAAKDAEAKAKKEEETKIQKLEDEKKNLIANKD